MLFSFFFITSTAIVIVIHYYLWVRKVRDTEVSGLWRHLLTGLMIAGALLIPTAMSFSRKLSREEFGSIAFIAFLWSGFVMYAFLFHSAWDAIRLVAALKKVVVYITKLFDRKNQEQTNHLDPDRRAFLARTVAGTALFSTFGISVFGVRSAFAEVTMPEIPVCLSRLSPCLCGFKIALISDIHFGPILGKDFALHIVEKTKALKPDLIAITGDVVDGRVELLRRDVAVLGELKARYGVYFVTGNHEYYSGVSQWVEFFKSLGFHVLGNDRVSIGDRFGTGKFDLAGIYDPHGGMFRQDHKPDLSLALAGRNPQRELILLAHRPSQVFEAAKSGVGLQLSGHTHGGQVWPFGQIVRLNQPYISGLHHHNELTQIYVTRGTGFWGPPMRVMAPAEITCIVLTT
jgi:predicted MPP superfamily phosphohydrolase